MQTNDALESVRPSDEFDAILDALVQMSANEVRTFTAIPLWLEEEERRGGEERAPAAFDSLQAVLLRPPNGVGS